MSSPKPSPPASGPPASSPARDDTAQTRTTMHSSPSALPETAMPGSNSPVQSPLGPITNEIVNPAAETHDSDAESEDRVMATMCKIAAQLADVKAAMLREIEQVRRQVAGKYWARKVKLLRDCRSVFSKIKDFWPKVFLHHPRIHPFLSPADDAALLAHLIDVSPTLSTTACAWESVDLRFSPNPFFTNNKLTITRLVDAGSGTAGYSATPVTWKADRDLSAARAPANPRKRAAKYSGLFALFGEGGQVSEELGKLFVAIVDEVYPEAWWAYLKARGVVKEEREEVEMESGGGARESGQ